MKGKIINNEFLESFESTTIYSTRQGAPDYKGAVSMKDLFSNVCPMMCIKRDKIIRDQFDSQTLVTFYFIY